MLALKLFFIAMKNTINLGVSMVQGNASILKKVGTNAGYKSHKPIPLKRRTPSELSLYSCFWDKWLPWLLIGYLTKSMVAKLYSCW